MVFSLPSGATCMSQNTTRGGDETVCVDRRDIWNLQVASNSDTECSQTRWPNAGERIHRRDVLRGPWVAPRATGLLGDNYWFAARMVLSDDGRRRFGVDRLFGERVIDKIEDVGQAKISILEFQFRCRVTHRYIYYQQSDYICSIINVSCVGSKRRR